MRVPKAHHFYGSREVHFFGSEYCPGGFSDCQRLSDDRCRSPVMINKIDISYIYTCAVKYRCFMCTCGCGFNKLRSAS